MQVIPDDSRQIYPVYVKPSSKIKLQNGDKVLVKITRYPDKNKYPEGTITEVFGRKGQPGVDLQIVIKKHGLSELFRCGGGRSADKARPVVEEDILVAATCVTCEWSPLTEKMPKTWMMPFPSSDSAGAIVWGCISPTFPTM